MHCLPHGHLSKTVVPEAGGKFDVDAEDCVSAGLTRKPLGNPDASGKHCGHDRIPVKYNRLIEAMRCCWTFAPALEKGEAAFSGWFWKAALGIDQSGWQEFDTINQIESDFALGDHDDPRNGSRSGAGQRNVCQATVMRVAVVSQQRPPKTQAIMGNQPGSRQASTKTAMVSVPSVRPPR